MLSMNKAVVCFVLVLATSTFAVAQIGDGERPEPTYDELVAHLGLSEAQLDQLDANKDDFLDAAAPLQQQIRDLKRQLRQAAQNGEDTTAIQGQIDAVKASIESTRATHVSIAQGILEPGQSAGLGELVAAETLMTEVRQGIGLLLMNATDERAQGGRRRGRGGPGGGGSRGPGGQQ